ncbi:substrate-binding domain-containing protein, partial [Paracoccus sp. UBA889]
MTNVKFTVSAIAMIAASATAAAAREQIQIAGSSTVLPYATIVAEAFGENTDYPTPVVESGGSSAGLKKFCEGVGENTIDIANASRAIKDSEKEACKAAGVTEIMEVRIGYDGIVFANAASGPDFAYSPADWFNALSAKVVRDGKVVDNTSKNWSEVNADLPDQEILAFIP